MSKNTRNLIIICSFAVLFLVPVSASACFDGWGGWYDCPTPPPPPPPIHVECFDNFDCGTDAYTGSLFCQGDSVYQNYINYRCNNPGLASSYCSNTTTAKMKMMCNTNQTCLNGSCSSVTCSRDSQCGISAYTGSPFCQGGNVYQNYITYTCNNPGTSSSSCTNTTTAQLKTTCGGSQTCSNGSCSSVTCSNDSQCGNSSYTGSLFCQGNSVYQNYITYTCNNPGTSSSYCSNATSSRLQTTCYGNQTCSNGSCQGQNCTSHSYQRCSGNYLYWYDSCGNQQDSQYCQNGCSGNYCQNQSCTYNYQQRCSGSNLYWYDSCGNIGSLIQYCPNGCSGSTCITNTATLTISKTVKNLTTSSAFSTSVSASPSDMVMFMITLQAQNQDVNNVVVRDTVPTGLTYSNQLVIARSNGSSGNYSGDIITGLNLNTISAGQTVTITYQAQLLGSTGFTFGTTTLNDPTYTTSSATGYNPTASASVIVTKAGVLGASTISTGLTNNVLYDSFIIPLIITLIGLLMWRSGAFLGVEKWFDKRNKNHREYKSQRELLKRIQKLR